MSAQSNADVTWDENNDDVRITINRPIGGKYERLERRLSKRPNRGGKKLDWSSQIAAKRPNNPPS